MPAKYARNKLIRGVRRMVLPLQDPPLYRPGTARLLKERGLKHRLSEVLGDALAIIACQGECIPPTLSGARHNTLQAGQKQRA